MSCKANKSSSLFESSRQETKDDRKDIFGKCNHNSVHFPLKSINSDIVDTALFHKVKEFLNISSKSDRYRRHSDFCDTSSC